MEYKYRLPYANESYDYVIVLYYEDKTDVYINNCINYYVSIVDNTGLIYHT